MNKELSKVPTESGVSTVGIGESWIEDYEGVKNKHDIITIYNTNEENEREGVILMDKFQAISLINALTDALMHCMVGDVE